MQGFDAVYGLSFATLPECLGLWDMVIGLFGSH